MSAIVSSLNKTRLSVKTQALAALLAVVGAVVVPQIFHGIGAVSGLGADLGKTFLPMHLPIIIVGLLAGPYAGAIAGALGPLASFFISQMPERAMLPFMMIELCAYGLAAGLLRNVKIPCVVKVLAVQIAGRALRAVAILAAVGLLDNESVKIASIWKSIATGLPGILLQLCIIPLVIYRVSGERKSE